MPPWPPDGGSYTGQTAATGHLQEANIFAGARVSLATLMGGTVADRGWNTDHEPLSGDGSWNPAMQKVQFAASGLEGWSIASRTQEAVAAFRVSTCVSGSRPVV